MSEDKTNKNDNSSKKQSKSSLFAIPSNKSRRGIDAIHVNSAREMVQLHTQGRNPQSIKKLPTTNNNTNNNNKSNSSSPSFSSISSSTFPKKISIPNHHANQNECKNPQCNHCGKIIIPSPQSSLPIQDKPSIKIDNWEIYTIKKPILNSFEIDYLNDTKFNFPLPEMIFGNNLVKIRFVDDNIDTNESETVIKNDNENENEKELEKEKEIEKEIDNSAIKEITFNAIDALDTLDDDVHLKVSYHEEWLKSRQQQRQKKQQSLNNKNNTTQKQKQERGSSKLDEDLKEKVSELTEEIGIKPYDWTYSTNYKGNSNIDFQPTTKEIPIDKLTKPDPILFFDEMILFEDELADNGISMLSTKIRVMPSCLLILLRFFLRIDNVIFRIRDCRVFIDFETNTVLREYKIQECDYDKVLKKSINSNNSGGNGNGDPKKALRDQNWVSLNIPTIKRTIEECIL
ncbi:TIP41 [Candida pseudojiufengensis]|uniref:TIP41 n=1 Tax=Candida pseudojiufengensis TaxID=497109 RepID=UPI0022254FD3|nr:TIP41 [Candida pseudojiufengensis]KAI5967812.1 TIP41 [Candida pseudojiufengensis]